MLRPIYKDEQSNPNTHPTAEKEEQGRRNGSRIFSESGRRIHNE